MKNLYKGNMQQFIFLLQLEVKLVNSSVSTNERTPSVIYNLATGNALKTNK
jgi:hypothetical protein